ncbi:MAG: hypothetical protein JWM99_2484, partial [Verrucomicrobiales bacterium]|nr:hypothetical protein [Verrucomicrobiales bacterium]
MDLQGTIQMTAAFSNAVLVAIMPYVSDFAAKLKLDLPLPLTTNQVQAFGPSINDIGGTVVLTNGAAFNFFNGQIEIYENPAGRRWDTRQEATTIDKLRLNPDQAVEAARTKIKALGYNLETLYADLQPKVKAPGKAYGKQYANYNIYWNKPNFQNRESVQARINGETGELEYLFLIGAPSLPPPPLPLKPVIKPSLLHRDDLDEAEKLRLFEKLAPEMDSMAEKLGLPITRSINRSQLKDSIAYRFIAIKSERFCNR